MVSEAAMKDSTETLVVAQKQALDARATEAQIYDTTQIPR